MYIYSYLYPKSILYAVGGSRPNDAYYERLSISVYPFGRGSRLPETRQDASKIVLKARCPSSYLRPFVVFLVVIIYPKRFFFVFFPLTYACIIARVFYFGDSYTSAVAAAVFCLPLRKLPLSSSAVSIDHRAERERERK